MQWTGAVMVLGGTVAEVYVKHAVKEPKTGKAKAD